VHAIAARMGGSFSAEHGGEQLKLRRRKTRARGALAVKGFFNASASGVSASRHRSTSADMVRITGIAFGVDLDHEEAEEFTGGLNRRTRYALESKLHRKRPLACAAEQE
jgi:hypothetical protein